MKTHTRAIASAIVLTLFALAASLYLPACTTTQKTQLRSDAKAVLGIGEAAAIRFTDDELKRAAAAIQ